MSELFPDEYFRDRNQTDTKRLRSFQSEKKFLSSCGVFQGDVLDFGCSTGEFLATTNWPGQWFGIEINSLAAKTAKKRGVEVVNSVSEVPKSVNTVVFRGVIQHLKNPLEVIEEIFHLLPDGGFLCFLATPNSNSIVYKLSGDLPALDKVKVSWTPSDQQLEEFCKNAGFEKIAVRYPYLESGYASWSDLPRFLGLLLSPKRPNFAFPRNMVDMVFKKPDRFISD